MKTPELLFQSSSEHYARSRPSYPAELFDALAAAAGLGADSRAVDLGCGPGTATVPLARRCAAVLAVDPSPEMLDAAGTAVRAAGLGNVGFARATAEEFAERPEGPVQAAVFGRSFHWTRRAEVLGLLDGCVSADGAVVLIEDGLNRWPWYPAVNSVLNRLGFPSEPYRASIEAGRSGLSHVEVLASSAFRDVSRETFHHEEVYGLDRVVDLQLSYSRSSPRTLGAACGEFTRGLRAAVAAELGPGPYAITTHTVLTVARRP